MSKKIAIFLLFLLAPAVSALSQTTSPGAPLVFPQQFVHPGILQNRADLDFMKKQIKSGERQWLAAYEMLQQEASLDFKPEPFTHVVRGSYGRQGQGHRELSASAVEAYRHALLYYISEDPAHAEKAISILSAWSEKLWDFDDNDAKLIAALTGQHFLNAAEILRYTYEGWEKADILAFEKLMLTVFYPYIRDFFTEANGNWDAAMIHTMLCLGIFTDRPDIFQRAAERFYWGPNNGGISKYIYPNGQIQEATRDWPHVQLGLGELAKAAQVAWTQGMDFYEVADNRLALGYEYTSRYMLGEEVPAYGSISPRGRGQFRDVYESVYQHYTQIKNVEMPYTAEVVKQTRPASSWYFLVSQRAPLSAAQATLVQRQANAPSPQTGALANPQFTPGAGDLQVSPGESIQQALEKAAGTGRRVILDEGIFELTEPLLIPSGTHLEGKGLSTILILEKGTAGLTMANKSPDLRTVTIRHMVLEGAESVDQGTDPNQGRRQRARQSALRREGIVFAADSAHQMQDIYLENVTVRNFTKHGVSLRGAANVKLIQCDFSDNGSNVVPGKGLHHNLHLTRVKNVVVRDGRFSNSPWGSGIHLSFGENVLLESNETARNKLQGIHLTESSTLILNDNLLEGNDRHGLFIDHWMQGTEDFVVKNNTSRNNGGKGIFIAENNSGDLGYNLSMDNREDRIYGKSTSEFQQKSIPLLSLLTFDSGSSSHVSRDSLDNQLLLARRLLEYYRARTAVKHPVGIQGPKASENQATDKDMQVAADALAHIMVGQPAYPPYFVGNDIDWESRPVKDDEWVWQLNRMTFWESMARAYRRTGEEQYAREWVRQMMDWVEKNPRDPEHHYAWRSIEAGIRGHRWTNLFAYFLHSPSFSPEALVSFLSSVHEHAEFLMSKYSEGSNWALMEAEGLAFIAMTFPEFKSSEKWLEEAVRRFNKEIHNQVYPDGHQRELAFGYHMGSIRWFLRSYEMAAINERESLFSEDYLELVEKMCEVPMKLAFPDGTTPQFGDAWTGKPGQYSDRLKEWGKLFDRPDFLYIATGGREGKKPEETTFAFKESGLYSMRSSWDEDAICLVIKCGPDGGGHSQPDNGTFELYAGGRNLTPDSGSFIYSGDPENRAWFRQTKVHQTLTLDGENAAYAPELLLWQPGEKHDILVVENQSYPELKHRRTVIFVNKEFFILIDEALGNARGELDLNFQLAPGEAAFDSSSLSVNTAFDQGYNLVIQTQAQSGISLKESEGQVSFVYTIKEPRPAFSYRIDNGKGNRNKRFITTLLPYLGKPEPIEVQVMQGKRPGSESMRLRVSYQGNSELIEYKF
ncbi:parallel beta-helix repeat (two copies) [Cyclobacterium lianum]|uniref:Parallel beta-helix repeat (Two copies) n=1 Tax=Cyclobacterium lianum TaxID=388280 RepID=A0A1M7LIA9_9BACT|nr:heparinase II/III family protein [Cyclobacterium lianum]SHM77886.1 parallel beta-helix repeat (two copies) [Cyclobacterium lianum]